MNKLNNTSTKGATTRKAKPRPKVAKPPMLKVPKSSSPAKKPSVRRGRYKYDVCLSFAGENRAYVSRVAKCLQNRGVVVFYDMDKKADLWGKNLVDHFSDLYGKQARYCVMFISEYYAAKLWTTYERRIAQARAFHSKKEYILPAYFDDTNLKGLPHTVADVDLRMHTPLQLTKVIIDKLRLSQPEREFKLPSASRAAKPSLTKTTSRTQKAVPKKAP